MVTLTANAADVFSAASLTTVTANSILDLGGVADPVDTIDLTGGRIQNGSLTRDIRSNFGFVKNVNGSTTLTTTGGLRYASGNQRLRPARQNRQCRQPYQAVTANAFSAAIGDDDTTPATARSISAAFARDDQHGRSCRAQFPLSEQHATGHRRRYLFVQQLRRWGEQAPTTLTTTAPDSLPLS